MRNDELVIRITQNGEILVENVEKGVTSFKKVNPSAFIDCVKNSIKTSAVSSGILPEGTCYFAAGGKDNTKICIEFPVRRCNITYEKTEYENFPLPRLIFGFVLSEERISEVHLGVAAEGMLTPKTKMFTYPFSNVSEFRVCCGGNRLPRIKSLHQLTGVMFYIMSMPNNNDHYHVGRTKLELELRTLFETLKDKSPEYYYTDVLWESKKTLQDFVKY